MIERACVIQGLRDLADFLDAHPNVPVPGSEQTLNVFVDDRATLAAIAREGRWEKHYYTNWFTLVAAFGPITLHINLDREQVCRKVVTGSRVVPARAAEPEHVEEVTEWICEDLPLLHEGPVNA